MSLIKKLKKWLKGALPQEIVEYYRKGKYFLLHRKNKTRTASEVFSDIYYKNLWGESHKSGEFYSGPGSEGVCADKYVERINSFIKSLSERGFRVIDLGCGDFRIGERIAKENNVDYVGVDVVPALIERNNNKYAGKNIKFICLDIASEALPDGDICLIREVLQHLSNDEINKILKKIKKYKYVFVTEGQPIKVKSYNKDKPHGQDTRLYNGSGVYLDKAPFNITNIELGLSISREKGELLNTFLIKN